MFCLNTLSENMISKVISKNKPDENTNSNTTPNLFFVGIMILMVSSFPPALKPPALIPSPSSGGTALFCHRGDKLGVG